MNNSDIELAFQKGVEKEEFYKDAISFVEWKATSNRSEVNTRKENTNIVNDKKTKDEMTRD